MAESIVHIPVVYDLEGEDFFTKFRLQFEKVLDVGMCGEIVLAIPLEKPDARRVVKKFSLLDEDKKVSYQEYFESEVKFMQSFDHRHVMKCIIAGKSPGYLAICMPYYWRGTLDCYIGDVGLQQSEILVTQVACALRYLHRNNVAHLDVKLDNIFLDDDFNAILGDFGLAVELPKERRTLTKSKCGGTRAYFAPERIGARDSTELDPFKMDSYSLGVVFWALLLEKEPAEDAHYYFEARKKSDLPEHTRKNLLKLLERDPSKRMSVEEFLTKMRRDAGLRYLIDKY